MRFFGNSREVRQIEKEVLKWPHVTAHAHRFGGREFRLGSAEIGHVHTGGIVDIPFPRPVHDALLAEGLAEKHRWVPDSGWTTFRVRNDKDLPRALWLLRISYLRYALKRADAAQDFFEQEAASLQLSPRFRSLLLPFVPLRPRLPIESSPGMAESRRSA
jgi:Family of unknown function (DUF5519)